MSVSLTVGSRFYEVGSPDFFHSFFSTISHHLEKDGWGSRFPALMKELYFGKLPSNRVHKAQQELVAVAAELSRFAPSEVIWDIEDLSKQPPWGHSISADVKSLADYFGTSDGQDLIEMMQSAFSFAREKGRDVTVANV